ncbi:crossover junction endodeoxyribonuclease RuvC [Micromonospora sp. WMMD1102]|uniref:crossover junction endodeoxyribonuclease RuvC n=1 Tax=Micromonospora sp. WMMD1102 TaxID=3016105 RepID=UPI0024155984|nr:crossover junction endodeoxyribonuclease RuvC [Micromonospora sp. WMMD1102]MDG4791894.1 crossover junction endodeoxyribonuclease RuvC [Micromonospora sp. WMMD1102]
MTLRAVAIDLALRATGLSWTCDHHAKPKPGTRTVWADRLAGHQRIHHILTDVAAAIACRPHIVAIEAMYAGTGKGGTPLRLAELHGVVTHFLWTKKVPYVYVEPQQIKIYVTGNGNADKTQVTEAVIAEYGHLAHVGTEHEADSFGLLALAAHAYDAPLTTVLNPKRTRAITSVRWPDLAGAR